MVNNYRCGVADDAGDDGDDEDWSHDMMTMMMTPMVRIVIMIVTMVWKFVMMMLTAMSLLTTLVREDDVQILAGSIAHNDSMLEVGIVQTWPAFVSVYRLPTVKRSHWRPQPRQRHGEL